MLIYPFVRARCVLQHGRHRPVHLTLEPQRAVSRQGNSAALEPALVAASAAEQRPSSLVGHIDPEESDRDISRPGRRQRSPHKAALLAAGGVESDLSEQSEDDGVRRRSVRAPQRQRAGSVEGAAGHGGGCGGLQAALELLYDSEAGGRSWLLAVPVRDVCGAGALAAVVEA